MVIVSLNAAIGKLTWAVPVHIDEQENGSTKLQGIGLGRTPSITAIHIGNQEAGKSRIEHGGGEKDRMGNSGQEKTGREDEGGEKSRIESGENNMTATTNEWHGKNTKEDRAPEENIANEGATKRRVDNKGDEKTKPAFAGLRRMFDGRFRVTTTKDITITGRR